MDADLKCNRLTCRKPLTDKAVVPVHFIIDFYAGVTDVNEVHFRSGNIRCIKKGRCVSLASGSCVPCWHSSFQQAVTRNLNDRNTQLQKQLENVVREGRWHRHVDILR
ncbi:hypothetical protein ID866_4707 [Astraeus odoratus]|nr:hypothetical protein ID866_4707 [Astraeus odoratus]